MQKWKVDDKSAGMRLDMFVAQEISNLSRSSIEKLIDQNKATVDGVNQKASYKLRLGQVVVFDYDTDAHNKVPEMELPILYEDDDCIVLNKKTGVLTHSKGVFNPEATVATFIAPRVTDMDGDRAGIVHRLDRATSGVIICAKNATAMKWLQKQFSSRKVKKTYLAVVEGKLDPIEAIIEMPIERNPNKPQTFRANAGGKAAITNYKVLKEDNRFSLVELQPHTGRTHQLRVHLKHLGHPILGDQLYDGKPADRLFLHAKSLKITLPNRERKIFQAVVPKEFEAIIG